LIDLGTWLRALALLLASTNLIAGAASAQNARGSATGPTTAKGYNHLDQFIHLKDVKPADNMYPVVPHPEQDKAARDKLAAASQVRVLPGAPRTGCAVDVIASVVQFERL